MAERTDTDAGAGARILYEDEWIVAVDKPAGIIVHGDGTGARTLRDLVAVYLDARGGRSDELQPLQRLDRKTTGIVLFSKQKDTQAAFDALIAERHISKRYLAIVVGRFGNRPRTFHDPIGRDRHDSRRMRASRTGKPAQTQARELAFAPADANGPARSLLSVDLLTGRKHQIRVHLSHAGFPILGDELYGPAYRPPARRDACDGRGRANGRAMQTDAQFGTAFGLMLHAAEESFEHPVTGEHICIRAPYPERFKPLFPCRNR